MSLKGEARRIARRLKEKGVPFLLRCKMAKKMARGDCAEDALKSAGAILQRYITDCECCGPTQSEFLWNDHIIRVSYSRVEFAKKRTH